MAVGGEMWAPLVLLEFVLTGVNVADVLVVRWFSAATVVARLRPRLLLLLVVVCGGGARVECPAWVLLLLEPAAAEDAEVAGVVAGTVWIESG